MAEEIELKLAASAEVLAAVREHPAVTAVVRGRPRTTRMSSIYYDTPKHDLAAAGVALRLRRAGSRWLQTVKGSGAAAGGMHRRDEFEWRVATPRVDPGKLAQTPWRKLFEAKGGYRQIFATDVRRSEQPIAFADGTQATLCFDVGEIRAGRRRAPLSEIEVELQSGDPLRLFELASALATDLPVRIEPASKAARGYALATRATPRPRRARDVELPADTTPHQALATLGAECIAHIEANAAAMSHETDPEYLHQLRVGWRRLRTVLKLAKEITPEGAMEPLEAELRRIGGELGPARDYDVFALQTLPRISARFRERGMTRLRLRAAARRRRKTKLARAAADSPQLSRLLIELAAFFAALPRAATADLPLARDWVQPILEARHRKLRKRARHAHRLGAAERHAARVAAKKLRYATELFASLFPGKATDAYVATLSRLQSVLGRLNDLEVAARLVDEIVARDDANAELVHASGVVRGWVAAAIDAELKKLRDVQRAFRRCEAFWSA